MAIEKPTYRLYLVQKFIVRHKIAKTRGELGIEPRATPTLRVYHTTRPHARIGKFDINVNYVVLSGNEPRNSMSLRDISCGLHSC